MNRDQIRGASRHIKGRAQTAIGGLAGDPAQQVRGAVNQVAGGAQYAYGRARDRADDLADYGRHYAQEAWERADDLVDDGRRAAVAARRRVQRQGSRALAYADANRTTTLLALLGAAFAIGWLSRSSR